MGLHLHCYILVIQTFVIVSITANSEQVIPTVENDNIIPSNQI